MMLDNKPQFVLDESKNPKIVRDSAERRSALSPTYERESEGIASAKEGMTDETHLAQHLTRGTEEYPMGSDPTGVTDTSSYDQSSHTPSHQVPCRSRTTTRSTPGFA